MFVDPPAPQPQGTGKGPPRDDMNPLEPAKAWVFNPEYQQLVELWQQVVPLLDRLGTSLDKAHQLARSRDVWDAPVGERYVEDITEWRKRLELYRQSVLTAISDQAADMPRWIRKEVAPPHAYS